MRVAGDAPSDPITEAARRLRVLWIDDEVRPDEALVRLVEDEGIVVDIAATGAHGLTRALSETYDAILVDLRLPDMYGLTVVRRLVNAGVRAAVFVVTGCYMEPEIDVDSRRLGAVGVLRKPFLEPERLVAAVRAGVEGDPSGAGAAIPDPPFRIVAVSGAMRSVLLWVESVARARVPVLVTGETGTGKELVARAIHEAGPRRRRPFVPVNCAAIPDTLFESELFGHKKGAFTGASEQTSGLVAAADGGTLFLDEVAEIPASIQARLLRCLEDGRVRRLGETNERFVDVRVIAATNRVLADDVARGRFRKDLYFRLSGASMHIPPLRQRREDIAPLIQYWLCRLSRRHANGAVTIDPEARQLLERHEWTGNVRQLRSVLEHALCLAPGPVLTKREIAAALGDGTAETRPSNGALAKARLQTELEAHHWNRTETARALGIGRTTLWRWLRIDKLDTDGV
jgi:DNA-binding NtrC family response regulator